MKIDKILIAADKSPVSAKVVQYGLGLAAGLGARVVLLSVIEPEFAAGNPDAGIFPDDALIALKAKTEEFLIEMKSNYGNGLVVEIRVAVGDIQKTIIETAVDRNAALIVVGTHGRTGLSKLFSGSVAESIIQHSPVPVLVVHQQ